MSESTRERRWRRERRIVRAIGVVGTLCAVAATYLYLLPLLSRQANRIVAARRSVSALHPVKTAPSRPVYPYSVIRGGAYSADELTDALDRDPVAARHYAGFRQSAVYMTASTFTVPVFLSYRIADTVYWTSRPVRLPKGETLLTDGEHYARARCGNRISPIPQTPVNDTEPAQEVMNTPQAPLNTIADLSTWTEDRLSNFQSPFFIQTPGLPVPLSAVPTLPTQIESTPPIGWATGYPGGFLATPVGGVNTLTLFPPGPVAVIQPNPIPGLVLPTTEGPPGLPTVPTPPPTVAYIPPNIFPPDLWPTPPTVPTIPGLPLIPEGPVYPTGPVEPVPEPSLLPPTLLACAAIVAATKRVPRRKV
jgi:hypothetical protein